MCIFTLIEMPGDTKKKRGQHPWVDASLFVFAS